MWQEMSYNKYNNKGDLFRINELYDERDNVEIDDNGFELDIIEMFEENE